MKLRVKGTVTFMMEFDVNSEDELNQLKATLNGNDCLPDFKKGFSEELKENDILIKDFHSLKVGIYED